MSEEEKKRIYEPLVIVDLNTKDTTELDGNPSDTVLSVKRAPLASDPRGEEEEENEAIEEDAMEEQSRSRLEKATNPPPEPFVEFEDAVDEPLFGEEEHADTAAVSLIPAVATTTVKTKKKPSFRSLRTKRKK